MDSYQVVCAVVCVLVAAIIDVRSRRIPNWLTLPAVCLAVSLNLALKGFPGLLESLSGMLAGFSLLFFVYALGGMGAGDVKLLAAVGAFVGPKLVFYAFIWMALSGGLLALAVLFYRKAFTQTFRNLKSLFLGWMLQSSQSTPQISLENPALLKLPYGVAIAAGTVMAVSLRRIPGFEVQDGTIRLFFWRL